MCHQCHRAIRARRFRLAGHVYCRGCLPEARWRAEFGWIRQATSPLALVAYLALCARLMPDPAVQALVASAEARLAEVAS